MDFHSSNDTQPATSIEDATEGLICVLESLVSKEKRFGWLDEALRAFDKEGPDVALPAFGHGYDRTALEHLRMAWFTSLATDQGSSGKTKSGNPLVVDGDWRAFVEKGFISIQTGFTRGQEFTPGGDQPRWECRTRIKDVRRMGVDLFLGWDLAGDKRTRRVSSGGLELLARGHLCSAYGLIGGSDGRDDVREDLPMSNNDVIRLVPIDLREFLQDRCLRTWWFSLCAALLEEEVVSNGEFRVVFDIPDRKSG